MHVDVCHDMIMIFCPLSPIDMLFIVELNSTHQDYENLIY